MFELLAAIQKFYEEKYKILLIIPALIFILAVAQISYEYYSTGSIADKDLSLKGGYFVKIPYSGGEDVNAYIIDLQDRMQSALDREVEIVTMSSLGKVDAVSIQTEIVGNQSSDLPYINTKITEVTGITENDFLGTGILNASLGASFFKETMYAIFFSFLFMSIVVFLYFRVAIPSLAVVLCAFADIVGTLAVFNLLGFKLSTAGISAFLMLIGYSVDTDILLTTKLLKQKTSTNVNENLYPAIKTGLTMTFTTLVAVIAALTVANSVAIRQIMTVLLIGLSLDIINTWITNVTLLKWHLEHKKV